MQPCRLSAILLRPPRSTKRDDCHPALRHIQTAAGKRIARLVLKDGHVVAETPLLQERCQRMLTVSEGPDGALYVLTDEGSGRLLRIVPG
jgi:glucose/arabinose dehydrogenase